MTPPDTATPPAAPLEATRGILFGAIGDPAGAKHFQPIDPLTVWAGDWDPPGPAWLHFDRQDPDCARWLRDHSDIHPRAVEALLSQETRPRCERFDDGLLLILRGVNLNPGADPEDMVSLRMFITATRLVTVRLRRLQSVADLADEIRNGGGPTTLSDLFARLVERLFARMEPTILDLNEGLDAIEEAMLEGVSPRMRARLKSYRYRAIVLRRYVAPQREALSRLLQLAPGWLDDHARGGLVEATDRVARYTEDLEAAREKCAMIQDEIANQMAERMNARMYVLSIVAAIFLPLGLLTGLLGINVGGMPGVESGLAFWSVTALLVVLGGVELWLLRRLKWL